MYFTERSSDAGGPGVAGVSAVQGNSFIRSNLFHFDIFGDGACERELFSQK